MFLPSVTSRGHSSEDMAVKVSLLIAREAGMNKPGLASNDIRRSDTDHAWALSTAYSSLDSLHGPWFIVLHSVGMLYRFN